MQIAKVRGTIVSTQKESNLTGVKFLLVQLIDEEGQLLPVHEVAADRVGAGIGEWVLISQGSSAREVEGNANRPIDAAVVDLMADDLTI